MRTILSATAVFFAFSLFGVSAEDTPAQPHGNNPPAYPASCYPDDTAEPRDQTVDIGFDIDRQGATENVIVLHSTDPCFEEVSVAAVRGWTYDPRRVDGRAQSQSSMQVNFRFFYQGQTIVNEFDARPIARFPPIYPDNCRSRSDDGELIVVQFSVSEDGSTENIEVLESTNRCFNTAALRAIEQWRYRPRIVDEEPRKREGVVVHIKFLSGYGEVDEEMRIRRSVASELKRTQRLINGGKSEEALARLDALEERLGDSMTRAELAHFHRARGAARLAVEDYEGALDDFRIVQSLGAGETAAINEVVIQLETALGVSSAQPPATGEEAGPEKETD